MCSHGLIKTESSHVLSKTDLRESEDPVMILGSRRVQSGSKGVRGPSHGLRESECPNSV